MWKKRKEINWVDSIIAVIMSTALEKIAKAKLATDDPRECLSMWFLTTHTIMARRIIKSFISLFEFNLI